MRNCCSRCIAVKGVLNVPCCRMTRAPVLLGTFHFSKQITANKTDAYNLACTGQVMNISPRDVKRQESVFAALKKCSFMRYSISYRSKEVSTGHYCSAQVDRAMAQSINLNTSKMMRFCMESIKYTTFPKLRGYERQIYLTL